MGKRHVARLQAIARQMRLRITYADLSDLDRDGDYHHATPTIRLQEGMAPRLWVCALAHELGHAYYGDEPWGLDRMTAKQERRADVWAALLLIELDAYREAERAHGGHLRSMAFELGVVEDTLEVFRSMLDRIGDVVYFRPGMGVGQWAERFDLADAV
jgi:Zn-dependent peptidase ImmA (M78 family)